MRLRRSQDFLHIVLTFFVKDVFAMQQNKLYAENVCNMFIYIFMEKASTVSVTFLKTTHPFIHIPKNC